MRIRTMKTLDVSEELPSVKELLDLASDENIILTTSEGRKFILAEIEDFDRELEIIRENVQTDGVLEAEVGRRKDAHG